MSLSLRQIRYVHAVSEHGSIQAASRALRISASSILAAVQLAEDALGARIFDRHRANGMQLTPAGTRFVAEGARLLDAEREFERQVGILQTGLPPVLRIGCFEPFGAIFMTEALRHLLDPEMPLEINLVEGDQTQLLGWLHSGAVDLVVTYDIGSSFGDETTRICKVPVHALMRRDDPLSQRDSISLVELARHPIVLLNLPQTAAYLLAMFDIVGVKPKISFRTRSYETVRSAVASGFGSALLNMRPIGEANADSPLLVRVPLSDDLPAPTLLIADLYGAMKPKGLRRVIDIIVSLFAGSDPRTFAVATPERLKSLTEV